MTTSFSDQEREGAGTTGLQSARVRRVVPSASVAVADRARTMAREGVGVLSLAVGEPDFDTPDHVKAAAIEAIHQGRTKYTNVDGTAELKQAIRDKFRRENSLEFSDSQIIAGNGGKQTLFNCLLATLDAGDEVIIPAPFWVSYMDMTRLADGVASIVQCSAQSGYKLTAESLAEAITPRTRALILNSPTNPTGAVYSSEELRAIADVLLPHERIIVISDDIYEHLLMSSDTFANIAMVCPELSSRTVVVNGVSKAHAMTGWRVGYAAGPESIIKGMKKIQSHTSNHPCSIAQAAATAALDGPMNAVEEMVAVYRERHTRFLDAVTKIDGLSCAPARGAFYLFPDVSAVLGPGRLDDDIVFAQALLERFRVAVVPGSAFGSPGHIRLSFATDTETLLEAATRMENFVATLS